MTKSNISNWSDNPDLNMIKGNIDFSEGQVMSSVRPSIINMFNELNNYIKAKSYLLKLNDMTENITYNISNEYDINYLVYINPSRITRNTTITNLYDNNKIDLDIPRNKLSGYYNFKDNLTSISNSASIPSGTIIYSKTKLPEDEWRLVTEAIGKYICGSDKVETIPQSLKSLKQEYIKVSTTSTSSSNLTTNIDAGMADKHRVRHFVRNIPVGTDKIDSVYHEHHLQISNNQDKENNPEHIRLYLYEKL